jgi:hypothetical protein
MGNQIEPAFTFERCELRRTRETALDVVERFFIGLAIMGGAGLLASFGALLFM